MVDILWLSDGFVNGFFGVRMIFAARNILWTDTTHEKSLLRNAMMLAGLVCLRIVLLKAGKTQIVSRYREPRKVEKVVYSMVRSQETSLRAQFWFLHTSTLHIRQTHLKPTHVRTVTRRLRFWIFCHQQKNYYPESCHVLWVESEGSVTRKSVLSQAG